jgi:hypothetical protein
MRQSFVMFSNTTVTKSPIWQTTLERQDGDQFTRERERLRNEQTGTPEHKTDGKEQRLDHNPQHMPEPQLSS